MRVSSIIALTESVGRSHVHIISSMFRCWSINTSFVSPLTWWLFISLGDVSTIRVCNGFAYTGGSTLASLSAIDGVQVTHLDAAKSFVQWAKQNIQTSCLSGKEVRYIVDDCMTFIDREIKRGKLYEGLIFDPPAFGRGPDGKVWRIETDLPVLVKKSRQLLSEKPAFVLLSCHDGVSSYCTALTWQVSIHLYNVCRNGLLIDSASFYAMNCHWVRCLTGNWCCDLNVAVTVYR